MSAPAKYTEREMIETERKAFRAGAYWGTSNRYDGYARAEAERRYPLPKVERPRLVRIGVDSYRVKDGVLQIMDCCHDAWHASSYDATVVHVLADMIANPTETVSGDDA